MSDPCRLRFTTWIDQKTGGAMLGEVVVASEYEAAKSQLAALREELATVRDTLAGSDAVVGFLRFKDARRRKMNTELRQRLADAERLNADFATELKITKQAMESLKGERTYADNSKCMLITLIRRASECGGLTEDWHEAFESAINHKPESEAASQTGHCTFDEPCKCKTEKEKIWCGAWVESDEAASHDE